MSRLTWVRNQGIHFDFDYGTVTLCGPPFQAVRLSKLLPRDIPIAPRNPDWTCVHSVWAVPRSLATTSGIADCFLFLRVLRCFTSPGLPPATMNSSQVEEVLPSTGFPIRTSTDQSLVSGSPWLFAATHVLHRLLKPRHPPHALSSLVTLDSSLPSSRSDGNRVKAEVQALRRHWISRPRCFDAFLPFVFGCQRARRSARRCVPPGTRGSRNEPGGADRNRTDDIQLAKLALYQLSYSPTKRWSPERYGGPRWI